MKTLALAFLLFAANPIIIDTTELGESDAVVRTEGGRRVTVRKTTEATVVPSTPPSGTLRYYACPKDAAMLRVPNAPADASYKCPVDGTMMREAVGPGRQYYLLE